MTSLTIDQYAVFGNPIRHSRSPQIHLQFAEQTGESINYTRQLVAKDKFKSKTTVFFDSGGLGLNITAPFKLEAFQFADELSARAQHAGAVNTLILKGSKIVGENTDGVGLVNDLIENLRWPLEKSRILVIGAGGAARGVMAPILKACPDSLVIVNRTASKAEELAKLFQVDATSSESQIMAGGFDILEGSQQSFDVIINASSASLSDEIPTIPKAVFSSALCYDMMYAKNRTAFLQYSLESGAESTADGLGMLVEQAAESFYLWRGKRPQTKSVIDSIRSGL